MTPSCYLSISLKHHRVGQSNSWGRHYCFSSGWCHLEGSALPEKDGSYSIGNDSAQGSWTQTLQFCSHSHQPRLSSWGSSRLCSPSVGFQGKWLQTEFCVLALQVAVCISSHLSLVDRSSTMFYSWILSGFLSQMWCFRMGSPTWGLEPPLLRGKPPAAEISLQSFSCHPWEPSQPSRVSSVLPTSHMRWSSFFFWSLVLRIFSN